MDTIVKIEQDAPEIDTAVERTKDSRLQVELMDDAPFSLTIESAMGILEFGTFKGERPVDDRHVQELFDEMANGRFRAEHVRIAVAVMGGDTFRINGQHTCWARTYMPKGYECVVRKLVYRVPNYEELKKLYSFFDPAYSSRTTNHLTRLLLLDTKATEGLSPTVIGHLSSAFKFWFWGDSRAALRRQGHNEVAMQVQKNPELFQAVAAFYQPFIKTPHVARRQAVIAAIFECWDKRPTLAMDFWKPVCDGLGLTDKEDARYVLMRWLQSHNLETTQDKTKKSTSAEEMYRICINAWNRWRAGEKIVGGMRATSRRVQAK